MADVTEHPKPKTQAVEEAVQLALDSRWQEALEVNDDLIERFGADEETSNRRGKALLELGRLEEAHAAYRATLEINPMNQIARRQTSKLQELKEAKGAVAPGSATLDVNVFTEEPGKTTITRLLPPTKLDPAAVAPGDPVRLELAGDGVEVRSMRGVDLGVVEPRLAQRIVRLSESGNRYEGAVTHVDETGVQVIIREAYQAEAMVGTVSFPVRRGREPEYRPYVRETLVGRDEERVLSVDEDEDPGSPRGVAVSDELEEGFSEFEEPSDGAESEESDEDVRPEDEY